MTGYGVFGGGGTSMVLVGAFDLVVGLIYLIALPRHLDIPLRTIILDQNATPQRGSTP